MSLDISEEHVSHTVNAITVRQPLGEFLVASMPAKILCDISYFDVRRIIKERDIETYLGIQRSLNKDRVDELQKYVRTLDACFPTAVILAINSRCAVFDEKTNKLTIKNDPRPSGGEDPINYRSIAKVLDGQHRIAGLIDYPNDNFEVNVSIFIDIDLEDQAYIFSTVNLAQTKVQRSLAYDLSELSKRPSPYKTCHNIAVALDSIAASPFYKKIKRLGTATPGRLNETLTQATFVEALMPFISSDPTYDRDVLKRGNKPPYPSAAEIERHPLRLLFISEKDLDIAGILIRYFSAVRSKWPTAWASTEKGVILNRTNGFRALMRVLRDICTQHRNELHQLTNEFFGALFEKTSIPDDSFNTDNYKPGTSGESELYNKLIIELDLVAQKSIF